MYHKLYIKKELIIISKYIVSKCNSQFTRNCSIINKILRDNNLDRILKYLRNVLSRIKSEK